MKLKKKLVTLGLVGIMGLAQCISGYAATSGFYVSGIGYNQSLIDQMGVATGSSAYTGGGSILWPMKDTITIDCYVSGITHTYKNSGFGNNAASASCSGIYYQPTSGTNEGFRQVNYTYQSVGQTTTKW